MTIHPSTGPNSVSAVAYPEAEDLTPCPGYSVYGGETVKLNFSSYFNQGTFDRFPDLQGGNPGVGHWVAGVVVGPDG